MGNDMVMSLVGAVAVIIVGFFIAVKGGRKWGFLVVAAGLVWGYTTLQPVIRSAGRGTATPEQNRRGYYRKQQDVQR